MLIKDVSAVTQLPSPALGLLNAVHTASVTHISTIQDSDGNLPAIPASSGVVYQNDTDRIVILPPSGNYPTRPLYPTEFAATSPTLFYKVINRRGNTRQIISCVGGVFTAVSIDAGLVNGQLARFVGFTNPVGFDNEGDYTIANLEGNTFQIQDSAGNLITNAAADVAGWVHTYRTNSYYPAHFERIAYSVSFSANSLKVGNQFTLTKGFTFRTVAASTAAVWNVIFEFGQRRSQTSPAPIGPNIDEYDFLPPAIDQQIVVTELASSHSFGLTFKKTGKTGEDFIDGQRLLYSAALNMIPGTYPTQDDFILRIRLGNFDIQDNIPDWSGYVGYMINDPLDPGATSAS